MLPKLCLLKEIRSGSSCKSLQNSVCLKKSDQAALVRVYKLYLLKDIRSDSSCKSLQNSFCLKESDQAALVRDYKTLFA